MGDGSWAGLFSGGKDSSWAVYRAIESGRSVDRLVTVHPPNGSFLYHVPATRLAGLAAESIGIPVVEVEADFKIAEGDSRKQGNREIEPLETAVRELANDIGLAGVTAGAVESEYQASRLRAMCGRLGIDLFTPLWREDPRELLSSMIDAGFEIRVVRVAAEGFDASWLGRPLDDDAIDALERLNERYGVHVMGEGGEFETLVTDGPHMSRPIEVEFETEWDGTRGHVHVTDAWLG